MANILDLDGISSFLGFAPQHIFYVVATSDDQYRSIKIPKNSDPATFRDIDIPTIELKGIQREILKKILSKWNVHDNVFSYVKNRSVVDAAREICGNKSVLKIDIKDFFPSISSKRVFGLFRSMGFSNRISYILTKLTTYKGKLAQGAPTSPTISNLILRNMDNELSRLAMSWEMKYIRYSDDIFFINDRNFNHPKFVEIVLIILNRNGFEINPIKTRFYPRGVPRKTLGLLTHGDKPAIPGPLRRRMRNDFYKGARQIKWSQDNFMHLKGMAEWHRLVYGNDDKYKEYQTILDTIKRVKFHVTYQSI